MKEAKYWYRKDFAHVVYYITNGEVWVEYLAGEGKFGKGIITPTDFNKTAIPYDQIQHHAIPYDILTLIKQYERYGIREELLKDILTHMAINIRNHKEYVKGLGIDP